MSGRRSRPPEVAPADVIARLWPDDDTTGALPDGASFDFFPVGTTTTGSDGSFAFDLDPSTIPPAFIDDDGRVDVEVMAGNGLLMTTEFITVQFIDDVQDATAALVSSSEGVLPDPRSWVSDQDVAVPAVLGMDLGDVIDLGSIRDESILDDFDVAAPDVGAARSWRPRWPAAAQSPSNRAADRTWRPSQSSTETAA